jgi:hypothetical protein
MSIDGSLTGTTIASAAGAEQRERSNRRLSQRLSFQAAPRAGRAVAAAVHFRFAQVRDVPARGDR